MAILIVVAARIGVWQCSQYCGFANGIVPYLRFACKKKNLQVPLANNHSVWCVCVYVVCVCARVRVCVCSMYYTVDLTFVPMRCKNIVTKHTRHASSRPKVYPFLCQVDYMPLSRGQSMETWPEEAYSLWWNLTGMRTGWYNLSMVVRLQQQYMHRQNCDSSGEMKITQRRHLSFWGVLGVCCSVLLNHWFNGLPEDFEVKCQHRWQTSFGWSQHQTGGGLEAESVKAYPAAQPSCPGDRTSMDTEKCHTVTK